MRAMARDGATADDDDAHDDDVDVDLERFVRDLLGDDDDDDDDDDDGGDDGGDQGGGGPRGGADRRRRRRRLRHAFISVGGYGGYEDARLEGSSARGGRRVGRRGDDVYGQRMVRRECALGGKVDDDVGEWCTQEGEVTTTPADHVAGTWATPREGAGFGISDDVEVGSEGAMVEVVANPLSTKPMEPMEPTNKSLGEFAELRGRRKRKSIFPVDARDFGLERLTHMLMLPADEAAAKLGVSATTFKHRYGVIRMRGYCLNSVARARRLARGRRNLTNGCVFFHR